MSGARCREAVAAFGPGVNYATKAFLCKAMARLVYDEGMNLDVSTGGEYHVARSAGVPPDRLVVHGNNKSVDELRVALAEGAGRIVVDSFDELDRLEALAEGVGQADGADPGDAGCRGAHPRVRPHRPRGQQVRVLGGVGRGRHVPSSGRWRRRTSIWSACTPTSGARCSRRASSSWRSRSWPTSSSSTRLAELSIGGGLGVAYVEGEEAPTITQWGNAIRHACAEYGIEASVTAEPGRAIVASAAVTLYTVGTIKDLPGIRTYVAVDGGMSDNPRPVLYGSGYETFLPRARRSRSNPAGDGGGQALRVR